MFFDDWYGIARVMIVGPLAYVALVVMLRASGKRTLSKLNAFDFVVTIAMGSILAAIILNDTVALLEGVAGMAMLIGLQFLITWLSVRDKRVSRLVKDEPTLVFHGGTYLDSQLKRMRVTKGEVEAAVRQHGHATVAHIGSVVLETDGSFSVVGKAGGEQPVIEPSAG